MAGNGQPWAFWVSPWVLRWRAALEGDHGVSYTGQTYDPETGLHYFRNRYYDAQTGRFTQEDPIGLAGGLNLYAYANNNPVNFTDPFGLCAQEDALCRKIVEFLRDAVGRAELDGKDGTVFGDAADILAGWGGGEDGKGRVVLSESDKPPLRHGWFPTVRRYGLAPGAIESEGNLIIGIDQPPGDFVGTAVHEILHIKYGAGHGGDLTKQCRKAIQNLPDEWPAPDHKAGRRTGC